MHAISILCVSNTAFCPLIIISTALSRSDNQLRSTLTSKRVIISDFIRTMCQTYAIEWNITKTFPLLLPPMWKMFFIYLHLFDSPHPKCERVACGRGISMQRNFNVGINWLCGSSKLESGCHKHQPNVIYRFSMEIIQKFVSPSRYSH